MRISALAALALAVGCRSAPQAPAGPPNFVFILADDLGWTDVGFMGSDLYETPHLDRLSRDGMTFTNGYSASPLCSPTRAAVLTGRSPARLWITKALVKRDYGRTPGPGKTGPPDQKVVPPIVRDQLPYEEITIAERMKEAGYATGFFGKWHLGPDPNLPEKHGFDVNIGGGHYPGPPSYFSPYRIKTLPDGPEGEHITDRLTTEAIGWIEKHADRPFYVHFSHYSVHGPWQAKKEQVEKYRAKLRPGANHANPVYAGMVESLDDSVGRLRAALARLGLAENTIIVFTSDNGGLLRVPGQGGKRPGRPPGGTPITSNVPLRGGKAWIHEGGIRVPLVVHWPGVTKPGSRTGVPAVSMDYFPTILEMAGLDASTRELDGTSLAPVLKGGTLPSRAIHYYFPHYIAGYRPDPSKKTYWTRPAVAIRKGNLKYIHYFGGKDELYDLGADIGEKTNLLERRKTQASALRKDALAWLKRVNAQIPTPNPRYAASAR